MSMDPFRLASLLKRLAAQQSGQQVPEIESESLTGMSLTPPGSGALSDGSHPTTHTSGNGGMTAPPVTTGEADYDADSMLSGRNTGLLNNRDTRTGELMPSGTPPGAPGPDTSSPAGRPAAPDYDFPQERNPYPLRSFTDEYYKKLPTKGRAKYGAAGALSSMSDAMQRNPGGGIGYGAGAGVGGLIAALLNPKGVDESYNARVLEPQYAAQEEREYKRGAMEHGLWERAKEKRESRIREDVMKGQIEKMKSEAEENRRPKLPARQPDQWKEVVGNDGKPHWRNLAAEEHRGQSHEAWVKPDKPTAEKEVTAGEADKRADIAAKIGFNRVTHRAALAKNRTGDIANALGTHMVIVQPHAPATSTTKEVPEIKVRASEAIQRAANGEEFFRDWMDPKIAQGKIDEATKIHNKHLDDETEQAFQEYKARIGQRELNPNPKSKTPRALTADEQKIYSSFNEIYKRLKAEHKDWTPEKLMQATEELFSQQR